MTPEEVQRLARAYLDPRRRTIGWYGPAAADRPLALGAGQPRPAAARAATPPAIGPMPPPRVTQLASGLPVIIQKSSLSPTAVVKLVLSTPVEGAAADAPMIGLGEMTTAGLAADIGPAITALSSAFAASGPAAAEPPSDDPVIRIEQLFAERFGAGARPGKARPVLVVVSGDVDPDAVLALLEAAFGGFEPAAAPAPERSPGPAADRAGPGRLVARIDRPLSQARIGYIVAAPAPSADQALAWRLLLYILSHDYEGRLGRAAISRQGLVYHIASDYRADGRGGWITLSAGVDPEKSDAMEATMRAELQRLIDDPPDEAEIAAAKQHLLGRDLSADLSNEEIAARQARQFLELGGLRGHEQLDSALRTVGRDDLIAAARGFTGGTIVRVEVSPTR